MIRFNELKISSHGKLFLDAEVKGDTYYDNVYIDKVIIDNQDSFLMSGPSSTPIYEYSFADASKEKAVSLVLDNSNMLADMKGDILFVYIITKGTPSMDTPCGMDNTITLGITYNEQTILNNYLTYIKEVGRNCHVPKGFIDYFLKVKAFELAIEVGNYTEAISLWRRFFKGQATEVINFKCGCNGIS